MYENEVLNSLENLIKTRSFNENYKLPLKVGIDLGTANIVMVVVDSENKPVSGITYDSSVVKDGIVFNYIGAIDILKKLKKTLEERINTTLINAAVAVPPGISEGNTKGFINVAEAAGFIITNVLEEPSAAATVLKIDNAAVVDIGGGTTGISMIKNKKIVYTVDEPTGGVHMSLTIAGHYSIDLKEAELIKKDITQHDKVFPIVIPVIEKMATITKKHIENYDIKMIYVVGGASLFDGFEKIFEKMIGVKVIKAKQALLVTPFGIAVNCL